jgi:hypothetical protein
MLITKLIKIIKIFLYWNLFDIYNLLIKKKINFKIKRNKISDIDKIIFEHFKNKEKKNINLKTFSECLKRLNKNSTIIETGSSAWGCNSSILFDSFVNSFGGKLLTCDLRMEPAFYLRKLASEKTTFYNMDSIKFLEKLKHQNIYCNLIYLDSMDINFNNFYPSMIHGLNEFFLADQLINKGGMILIDDTPANIKIAKKVWSSENFKRTLDFYSKFKFIPGKGSLVNNIIKYNSKYKIILHEYQLLIKKIS